MENKAVKFSINYNTINNISLFSEYEKMYRKLDFSHKYIDTDTNDRITYDDLIKLMNDLKKENIINGYSGEGTEFRSSYILYYNPRVVIKYNNKSEMIKYFTTYEDALEYYNKINKKINFLELY